MTYGTTQDKSSVTPISDLCPRTHNHVWDLRKALKGLRLPLRSLRVFRRIQTASQKPQTASQTGSQRLQMDSYRLLERSDMLSEARESLSKFYRLLPHPHRTQHWCGREYRWPQSACLHLSQLVSGVPKNFPLSHEKSSTSPQSIFWQEGWWIYKACFDVETSQGKFEASQGQTEASQGLIFASQGQIEVSKGLSETS